MRKPLDCNGANNLIRKVAFPFCFLWLVCTQLIAQPVAYNTADLQGSWQMHDLVAGKVGSLSTWAGWLHGAVAFDANGNGTISGVAKSDGSTTSVAAVVE
jgi:hypothetical protein